MFQKIRESVAFVGENATDVRIDDQALDVFVASFKPGEFKRQLNAPAFPLRFETQDAEMNLYCLLSLLHFGSGYDQQLLSDPRINRTSQDAMAYGLMKAHINGSKLDMEWLSGIEIPEISQLFEIPISRDERTQTPGLYLSVDHPLKPLADKVMKVLTDVGGSLSARRFRSLAHFVQSSVEEDASQADVLLKELVSALRPFRDEASYKGQTVHFFRKAQILISLMYGKFRGKQKRFQFPDLHLLTAVPGTVLPAVLRHLGILVYSDSLAEKVDNGNPLGNCDAEVEIRALSIIAVDELVKRLVSIWPAASKPPTAMELDAHLWRMCKTIPDLKTHVNTDTTFY